MNYSNFRKSRWLYGLLLPVVHTEYRYLFRKIYLHNVRGVPSDKPVLIASNHPTAFIDPIFFCLFFDPPVYNMTRGDIFRKPFFRKLLESLNMFPVFRRRDGYEQRGRNDEVFEFCQQKLKEGVAVNIFVEGEHHLDKRVLPLQKGIARIAFGTYEKWRLEDLQVIPVGCNYLNGATARDEARIIVGTPIFIRDYWSRYEENPAATINQLCADILAALKQICYQVEDRADDVLVNRLLEWSNNEHPAPAIPVVYRNGKRFFREKILIERINGMPETEKNTLKAAAETYSNELKINGLTDESLTRPDEAAPVWWLLFIFGFIPWVAGAILRWPSAALAGYLARTKVKKAEFVTSILLGGSFIVNFFAIVILLLCGLLLGNPACIALGLLWPLLLWFSIFYRERWQLWWTARRALKQIPLRKKLLAMREEIRAYL